MKAHRRAAVAVVALAGAGAAHAHHHAASAADAATEAAVIPNDLAHIERQEHVEASRDEPLPSSATTSTTTEARQPTRGGTIPTPPASITTGTDNPAPAGWRDLGTFTATAYCLEGRTASGAEAGPGSIAVDPSVVPLGARLHVAGYGAGTAEDTGGAIRGRRLDLWMSCSAARAWGVRTVDVEEAA